MGIALLSPHESAHFPVVRAKYAAQLFGKPVNRRFLCLCGVPLDLCRLYISFISAVLPVLFVPQITLIPGDH